MAFSTAEETRQVMTIAQEEARSLFHHTVDTEHVLLALLHHEHGIASRVLESLGVLYAQAREQIIARGEQGTVKKEGRLPQSKGLEQLFQGASEEASRLKAGPIRPEHLLLSLSRLERGPAVGVLSHFGVAPRTLRERTLEGITKPRTSDSQTNANMPVRSETLDGTEADLDRSEAIRRFGNGLKAMTIPLGMAADRDGAAAFYDALLAEIADQRDDILALFPEARSHGATSPEPQEPDR